MADNMDNKRIQNNSMPTNLEIRKKQPAKTPPLTNPHTQTIYTGLHLFKKLN